MCGPQGDLSSTQQCVLQPLMVAAAAAMHQQLRPRCAALHSPHDMAHIHLLLQRIAARAVESAASGPGPQQSRAVSSSRAAAAAAGDQVLHRKLQHQSQLLLDLEQLQQLLLWAVLAPGCTSQSEVEAASQALADAFSAGALGVKEQQELCPGVRVVGSCIADALEDVAEAQQADRQGRMQRGGDGVLLRQSSSSSSSSWVGHGLGALACRYGQGCKLGTHRAMGT